MNVHQGDVFLERVEKLPEKAVFVRNDIVQYGEITGHAHKIQGAKIYVENGIEYVVASGKSMTHEDHPITDVPAFVYRKKVQKEFFPSEKNGTEGFYAPIPD